MSVTVDLQKIIHIQVIGETGTGKTEVLAVIEKALRDHYGSRTLIVSGSLANERELFGDPLHEGRAQCVNPSRTVFVLEESNLPRAPAQIPLGAPIEQTNAPKVTFAEIDTSTACVAPSADPAPEMKMKRMPKVKK